jgi:hypothetical protein
MAVAAKALSRGSSDRRADARLSNVFNASSTSPAQGASTIAEGIAVGTPGAFRSRSSSGW